MFPFIKNTPTYTLNVPKLSGGVNLRDGLTLINDNQLTDVKNMWFKDGMLKTRPKLHTNDDVSKLYTNITESYLYRTLNLTVRSYPECVMVDDNDTYILQVIAKSKEIELDRIENTFTLRYVSDNLDVINLGEISIISYRQIYNYLVFQHNGDIYLFASDDEPHYWVVKRDTTKNYNSYLPPKELFEEDMTAPLVATNCLPQNSNPFTGDMVNGYNLIGKYAKVIYSTVNPDISDPISEQELHYMHYMFPSENLIKTKDFPKYAGLKVKAIITDKDGNKVPHEVVLDKDGYGRESLKTEDGLVMEASPIGIDFLFIEEGEEGMFIKHEVPFSPDDAEQIKNNLEIIFPVPQPYGFEKVVNMTKSAWYGGTAYGIHGGSRLFLGGNTNESEQALVVWSDLNDPLYFSENNYAYVGDKTQAVTVFGRQGESLIIFKEREIFSTQYVQPDAPTAEEVINQSVIDLSTQSAYFPITQVHGYIGCDRPDTVQLCRNRLVWATSDGKVYTLVSQNQYNECAVFCISEMIERQLKKESNLTKALSADYDGYYILVVNNRMYVMDYNSYGYNYVSSYSKTEDANLNIPWYFWELPIKVEGVESCSDRLIMTYSVDSEPDENLKYETAVNLAYIDSSVGDDELNVLQYDNEWKAELKTIKVPSYLQTKLYDFGSPAKLKSVPTVNFSFGYNDGEPIKIEFISERNIPDEHSVTVDGVKADERSPEHVHQCRLFPYTKGTVMFGARLSCEGNMSIASITLQYKALGGAK